MRPRFTGSDWRTLPQVTPVRRHECRGETCHRCARDIEAIEDDRYEDHGYEADDRAEREFGGASL